MKLVRETQKILDDKTIAVTATAVRVPIVEVSEAVNNFQMTLKYQTFKVYYIIQMVLSYKTTMILIPPMPMYAQGKDDVFVGRIRRDESQANTLNMWIVADNLRKGAATNTIQIAEYLVSSKLV
jgi:aspartate-semialdehyde dehydrogenase